jgi:hypothetical protein
LATSERGEIMAQFIAFGALIAVIVWTLMHVPGVNDMGAGEPEQAKLREHLVADIRGANRYCLAYIALLGVLASIAAGSLETVRPTLTTIPLWPFAVAFGAATLSMLFIPAGFGAKSFVPLRNVWVRTILCEQITVVAAGYGIWSLITAVAPT